MAHLEVQPMGVEEKFMAVRIGDEKHADKLGAERIPADSLAVGSGVRGEVPKGVKGGAKGSLTLCREHCTGESRGRLCPTQSRLTSCVRMPTQISQHTCCHLSEHYKSE